MVDSKRDILDFREATDSVKSILKPYLNKQTIYMDLEYIHETIHIGRPEKEHWKEIVKIDLIEFDHEIGKEVLKFSIVVKPSLFGNKLDDIQWQIFNELTGLTKEYVSKGCEFKDAMKQLCDFVNGRPVIIMSGDEHVIEFNSKICNMDKPNIKFLVLKPILLQVNKEKYSGYIGGDMYKLVGLEMNDIKPHNESHIILNKHESLFNARSIAFFVHLIN
jgi:hypothetical protein